MVRKSRLDRWSKNYTCGVYLVVVNSIIPDKLYDPHGSTPMPPPCPLPTPTLGGCGSTFSIEKTAGEGREKSRPGTGPEPATDARRRCRSPLSRRQQAHHCASDGDECGDGVIPLQSAPRRLARSKGPTLSCCSGSRQPPARPDGKKERLFSKTITHEGPRPIAEGSINMCFRERYPRHRQRHAHQPADYNGPDGTTGSMCRPCVSKSATAFHI